MIIPAGGLRGVALREAAADLRQQMELVRYAIDQSVNVGKADSVRKWLNVEAFYADRMIVEIDARNWSYPYTLANGTVTLGEPQEVVETYVPLREGAAEVELRLVESAGEPAGQVWEVTIIQAGLSANRIFYSDDVLRESAPLFEGAKIFIKADIAHLRGDPASKSVDKLVGWVEAPRFVEGAAVDTGRTVAKVRLPGLSEETRNLLVEASRAGKTDLVGLSIDAFGKDEIRLIEGQRVRAAKSITRVGSVDLIVEPGAGGRLVRLVEAAPASINYQESSMLRDKLLATIQAKAPAIYVNLNPATATDDEIEVAYREALNIVPASAASDPNAGVAGVGANAALDEVRMIEARMVARELIAASTLPAPAKDRLNVQFAGQARFAEADVRAAIEAERTYLAKFVESGRVDLGGLGTDIELEDRSTKMADMLDAFFDPAHKNHRDVRSFREAYVEFTGDRLVTGRLSDADRSRLRSASGAHFREALDSTSWADALGNAVTRRLQALYTGDVDLQAWRRVVTINSLKDFRTVERARIGGYGNLPIVAQSGSYDPLASPGDDKASYAPDKRGGTETVTREMILNDDVAAIRRIPLELQLAASNTLYEFVFDFFRTNPVIWDTKALYHVDHGNLFTTAFDADQFAAHRLAMVKQTRAGSGKRMGVSPALLLLPFEQQQAGFNAFQRTSNLDKTFVQTMTPQVIVVSYWTDANDWVTLADPAKFPVLELGFINGQEEPELFIQDMPNVGSMFSNDKLTMKIRHEYGGGILVDGEKGTTKAVVA